VISELVANSVEHGRGTIQLSVEHIIAAIHGSVTAGIRHGSTQVWFDITLIGSREPGEPNPNPASLVCPPITSS